MPPTFDRAIPIFRMFDVDKAKEFYVGFLGFTWDWEHRFFDGAPLYAQVSRGDVVLHLSEHHGDGTPGSVIYVPTTNIDDFHAELAATQYRYGRPGIEEGEIGRSITVSDPFGNTLRFNERLST